MGLDDVAACVLHNLGRVVGLGGDLAGAERIERQAGCQGNSHHTDGTGVELHAISSLEYKTRNK